MIIWVLEGTGGQASVTVRKAWSEDESRVVTSESETSATLKAMPHIPFHKDEKFSEDLKGVRLRNPLG